MATVTMDHAPRARLSGYSRVAVTLHWLIAVMIIGSMTSGILHNYVDEATAAEMMAVHKPAGFTILALSLCRLGWRLAHGTPPVTNEARPWQAALARATHVALYALMIGVPLAGWLMVSAGPDPFKYFGLFDVPKLPVSRAVAGVADEAHTVFAVAMLALVALHVAAALKHHFIDRDDVLVRMLPLLSRRAT